MKKGAALSLVLAFGGTTKFCVTHGVAAWASACGMDHTADIIATATATCLFFIACLLGRRVSRSIVAASMVRRHSVVKAPAPRELNAAAGPTMGRPPPPARRSTAGR